MKNEFIYAMRVHIEDTDYGGIVYHSNYLNFMERARSEWALQLGIGSDWQREQGVLLPVHSAYIEFIKPARLHEQIEVVSRIAEVRSASFMYHQSLRLSGSPDKMLCKAEIRLACVDMTMRARRLPELPLPMLEMLRRDKL